MKNRILLMAVIGMVSLGVMACGKDKEKDSEKETQIESQTNLDEERDLPLIRDIESGSISDGEWEYYYYYDDMNSKKSGLVRRRINDGYIENLIVNNKEYEFRSDKGANFCIAGEWLYLSLYYMEDENYYLCKMKKDGTEIERLVEVYGMMQPLVKDGYIYYWTMAKGHSVGIYQVKTDGTEVKVLYSSDQIEALYDVIDGWIYFENFDEKESSVKRIKTDGTGEEIVLKTSNFGRITYHDEWIYYETSPENENGDLELSGYEFSISRNKIGSKENEEILKKTYAYLYDMKLINNVIFLEYCDYSECKEPLYETKVCYVSINVDGTGEKEIEKNEYPAYWTDEE